MKTYTRRTKLHSTYGVRHYAGFMRRRGYSYVVVALVRRIGQ